MKIYSDDAVTKADIDAMDTSQNEALKELKFWVWMLAGGFIVDTTLIIWLGYSFVK